MNQIPHGLPRHRRLALDLALVLLLAALTVAVGRATLYSPHVHNPKLGFVSPNADRDALWALIIVGGQLAAVLWWRRLPVLAFTICAAGVAEHVELLASIQRLATQPGAGPPLLVSDATVAIALYGITVRHGLLRSSPALAITAGLAAVAVDRSTGRWSWTDLTILVLAALVCWVLGGMTRTRRAYLRSIEQQAADQQRRRAQELELAAAAERERITRDIHDSVAHGLSVMVVQAQAAAAGINSDPSSAQESIEAVITTGRQSLAEMRRALGSLSDESDAAHHEPLSRRLTALAEQARATGTPVRLDLDSQLDDLPRELVETAYRVVQESLTNARDHAGATSSVNIVVTRAHGGITVEVTNDGAAVDGFNDGLGINGMRERVRLAGGQLHAGPRQSGGFAVTALLPLSSTPAPTPPARPS